MYLDVGFGQLYFPHSWIWRGYTNFDNSCLNLVPKRWVSKRPTSRRGNARPMLLRLPRRRQRKSRVSQPVGSKLMNPLPKLPLLRLLLQALRRKYQLVDWTGMAGCDYLLFLSNFWLMPSYTEYLETSTLIPPHKLFERVASPQR
jgi:hypothetical protein